jgi:sialate O-acetylesterase
MLSKNSNNPKILWMTAICIVTAGGALANVRLPRVVDDNMVLQRDAKVVLWGWADPAENITITFHGAKAKIKADKQGQWSMSFGPFPAGGPYEITIKGKNNLRLHDILIGDVWLASGQSNMEFPLGGSGGWKTGVNNAAQEIDTANFPEMRLFKVHQKIAFSPAQDVEATGWTAVTPESIGNFSAVAYLFGRELHQRYRVPIGLIETDWGGTVAEAWVSEVGLKSLPEFRKSMECVSHVNEEAAVVDHERYLEQKDQWELQHASEDRGWVGGRAVWADPTYDVSTWPKIVEPQMKPEGALKGFDGAVWFRREITIPEDQGRKGLQVHLAKAGQTDTTYFNGEEIGKTTVWDKPRDYFVPAKFVKVGQNVIAIRMTGNNGFVGMLDFDNPDKLNVEIGGTTIPLAGTWSYQPGPDLTALPQPSAISKVIDDPNMLTVLFNSMISPLIPFRIKGIIWYQGESNAPNHSRSAQYRTLFPALIADWRKQWGYEIPFLFVQLAGFGHNQAEPAEYPWAELREAQSMTLSLPATGMATTVDIGDENDIHPRDKQDVAHRLLLVAARLVYGENVVDSGPIYQSIQIEGNRARIKFSSIGSGLLVKDKYGYIRGFEIAAADGKFHWAQAQQAGQDIVVFNESIVHPAAVRYDWSNTPDGNLFNKEGLPAVPFRTDLPKQYLNE